jgi:universal stress protein E
MKNLETILLGTNFTAPADQAGALAAALSKRTGAKVVVVHAVDEIDESLLPVKQVLRFANHWMARSKRALEGLGARVADIEIIGGKPADVILQSTEEVDANLIVLAAGSPGSDGSLRLGEVADRVLRRALAPVLLVHPSARPEIRRILCAFDYSDAASHALKNAVALASLFDARLTVLRTLRSGRAPELLGYDPGAELLRELPAPDAGEVERRIREEEAQLERYLARVDAEKIVVDRKVQSGTPYREILSQAEEGSYDLLALGAIGKQDNPRVFIGRTAKRIAQSVPCSLLFLRQTDFWQSPIEEDVEKVASRFREGRELAAKGLFPRAISRLRFCLNRSPYFAPALEELSRIYLQMGHTGEADALAKKAKLIREKLWALGGEDTK